MAFTYTAGGSKRDDVRLLVADTDTADSTKQICSDAEIDALLSLESNEVYAAAAAACESIAGSAARSAVVYAATGMLRIDRKSIPSEFRKLAETFRKRATEGAPVEEIDSICSAYDLPETFSRIIARGRHRNITLIGVTPAPFGIHRDLTRQAKEIYVFSTNEPRDRFYLRSLLGKEIESKLDALGQYEYVKWEDDKDQLEIGKA